MLGLALLLLAVHVLALVGMFAGVGGGASLRSICIAVLALGLAYRAWIATNILERGYGATPGSSRSVLLGSTGVGVGS